MPWVRMNNKQIVFEHPSRTQLAEIHILELAYRSVSTQGCRIIALIMLSWSKSARALSENDDPKSCYLIRISHTKYQRKSLNQINCKYLESLPSAPCAWFPN